MIDDGIKKMWYINTGDYYSAVKIRIMLFVATWMDLDIITLSEISQRDKHWIIPLICGI